MKEFKNGNTTYRVINKGCYMNGLPLFEIRADIGDAWEFRGNVAAKGYREALNQYFTDDESYEED